MLILSIEASTQVSSIALFGDAGLVAEYTLCHRTTQSERLLPAVHRLLGDVGRALDDLDAVVVSVGPGSFTGVRVAVCTAKGLACAGHKPVIAVSSLAGLARRFAAANHPVCSLLDARKGEVYTATFRMTDGAMRMVAPEKVISPELLSGEIREPTLLVGEGALKYKSLFQEHMPSYSRFVPGVLNYLSAASVAEIGYENFEAGRITDPSLLVPNYIRRPEAEIAWENRS
jgi:tRNA threonylcarbamoyladenosine biosynthesis protein TsaB